MCWITTIQEHVLWTYQCHCTYQWSVFRRKLSCGRRSASGSAPVPSSPSASLTDLAPFRPKTLPAGARPNGADRAGHRSAVAVPAGHASARLSLRFVACFAGSHPLRGNREADSPRNTTSATFLSSVKLGICHSQCCNCARRVSPDFTLFRPSIQRASVRLRPRRLAPLPLKLDASARIRPCISDRMGKTSPRDH